MTGQPIGIIGAGAWGTALASVMAQNHEQVLLWALEPEVVAAVNGGLLSINDVCERYDLTLEEFASWQRAVDRSGMPGLRVTRIQHYRDLYERQQKY